MPDKSNMYSPAKHCIYCNTQTGPLTREHIIPYSLGGNIVLPKASCAEHAALTSELEREVARDTYGVHRAHEGAPSRRKGRHELVLNSTVEVEGVDNYGRPATASVRVGDLPKLPMVVILNPPKILSGTVPDAEGGFSLECAPDSRDPAFNKLMTRLGWSKISANSAPIRVLTFLRVLAKIGHAFACAEIGSTSFAPTLLPLILGNDSDGLDYVGGFSPAQEQSNVPLLLREEDHQGKKLLIAEISLLFLPKLPRYQVVCGILP